MTTFKKVIIYIGIIAMIIFIDIWFKAPDHTSKKNEKGKNDITQIIYLCPSEKNIQATFHANKTVSVTKADGHTVTLKQTRSADGGRYANKGESFVLWEKGSFAMITRKGDTETCINKEDSARVNSNKRAIKKVVKGFGIRLQRVSLLAPNAAQTIARVYAPYVTPPLLLQWKKDPSNAPGRRTSSPWPDHFDINKIQPGGVVYSVDATLVLMTGNEVEHGGNAGTKEVEMTMAKRNGKWMIASYKVQHTSKASAKKEVG